MPILRVQSAAGIRGARYPSSLWTIPDIVKNQLMVFRSVAKAVKHECYY